MSSLPARHIFPDVEVIDLHLGRHLFPERDPQRGEVLHHVAHHLRLGIKRDQQLLRPEQVARGAEDSVGKPAHMHRSTAFCDARAKRRPVRFDSSRGVGVQAFLLQPLPIRGRFHRVFEKFQHAVAAAPAARGDAAPIPADSELLRLLQHDGVEFREDAGIHGGRDKAAIELEFLPEIEIRLAGFRAPPLHRLPPGQPPDAHAIGHPVDGLPKQAPHHPLATGQLLHTRSLFIF